MSDDRHRVRPNTTPLERVLQSEQDRINERQRILGGQNDGSTAGGDIILPPHMRHTYTGEGDAKKKNFDQKIYLFPQSFNALRRFMEENYPVFFNTVNPDTGVSTAYCMVNDAPQFIGLMNGAFDLAEQMDSDDIEGICKRFLDAARIKKGLSRLG